MQQILSGKYDIDKGQRLKNIGFIAAKKAVEAQATIADIEKNKALAETIEYFKANYPFNKFITEDMVKSICQKYGLLCAKTKYYISDVPEKNLQEIESFKLKESEMQKVSYGWYKWERNENHHYLSTSSKEDNGMYGYYDQNRWSVFNSIADENLTHHFTKPDLEICASIKDFDTKNMRIEDGYKLELNLPDPIVLQPVKGGYLIVSKWGLEGNDESLINEINN